MSEASDPEFGEIRRSRAGPAVFDLLMLAMLVQAMLALGGVLAFRWLSVAVVGSWGLWPDSVPANLDRVALLVFGAVTGTGMPLSWIDVINLTASGRWTLMGLALLAGVLQVWAGTWLLARAIGAEVSRGRVIVVGVLVVASIVGSMVWTTPTVASGFDAVSALLASGMTFGPARASSDPTVLLGLLPLMAIGLLGPSLVLKRSARTIIAPGAILAAALVAWLIGLGISLSQTEMVPTGAARALVESISGAGAGLAIGSEGLRDLPSTMQWAELSRAFVGAVPGSLASGLSVLPIVLIVLGLLGKIDARIASLGGAWIILQVLLVLAVQVSLLATTPNVPADRLLFLSVGFVSNMNVAHDPLSLTGTSSTIACLAMLAGRLLPLLMLAWMAMANRSIARIDETRRHEDTKINLD